MAVLQVPGLAREDSPMRPQKQLWAKYTKMMAEYLLAVQAPLKYVQVLLRLCSYRL